ncbi:tRNA pseudouridine synthase B [Paraliobacillus sp. PM-2]|uniref:tRNA pseudouridine(55) synthase TruB n=1 Tax=Paraliobacillus sp. PM-2 TaxID=1462524 RepID=UPI00061C0024|nr:tRNA pseudouridine(55) synthase TruB [Paraliobacillus sp. PM-2]CQR47653.1 tRNA pseudouridine synthase B [Paraliobacillus sp. PM-2]
MDGIIPLWKEKGKTSHDCVMELRRICQTKKVGHTGTLDPEVEGVLPICINQATKIVPFLTDTKKTYQAQVTLGYTTDTEDSTGETITKKPVNEMISEQEINTVLQSFVGNITQVVPLYSAVKVNGRKLYEYARNNIPVNRPSRQVWIESITYIPNTIKADNGLFHFSFEVNCSKGTYIRTLCVDLGEALGYPAHMSALVRTKTGGFSQEHAVTIAEVKEKKAQNELSRLLFPISYGVKHLARYEVDRETSLKVANGQKLPKPTSIATDKPFRVEYQDNLLAIYQKHPNNENEIKPVRVFQ